MGILQHRKKLSKTTAQSLLNGENDYVDFKAKPAGLSSEDLVAFANSSGGGKIYLGVKEEEQDDGSQIGIIAGSKVDDTTVLSIMNKAADCIPPVAVSIEREDCEQKSLLIVCIYESGTKPHATRKGIYSIRDGSRNRPLHPNELLEMFVEREAQTFALRFEEATARIETRFSEMEQNLSSTVTNMANQLGWADHKLDDTDDLLNSINRRTTEFTKSLMDVHKRLRALFRQDQREDEIFESHLEDFIDTVVKHSKVDKELKAAIVQGDEVQVTITGRQAVELNPDEISKAYREAVKKVINGLDGHDSVKS